MRVDDGITPWGEPIPKGCECREMPEEKRPCKPCAMRAFNRLYNECKAKEDAGLKAWQPEDFSEGLEAIRREHDRRIQEGEVLQGGFRRRGQRGLKIGGKADDHDPIEDREIELQHKYRAG